VKGSLQAAAGSVPAREIWHRARVLPWDDFASSEPELAASCRGLMYQYGVGLAFLATVRSDGGPRVHPICPLIAESGLFAFLVPSPKRDDLHRDGRYAMHSFPADENEDAFYLTGRARSVQDRERRRALQIQFLAERDLEEPPEGSAEQELFVFELERCLYTVTSGHGDPEPRHRTWRAP
jgi:hypothetical protein